MCVCACVRVRVRVRHELSSLALAFALAPLRAALRSSDMKLRCSPPAAAPTGRAFFRKIPPVPPLLPPFPPPAATFAAFAASRRVAFSSISWRNAAPSGLFKNVRKSISSAISSSVAVALLACTESDDVTLGISSLVSRSERASPVSSSMCVDMVATSSSSMPSSVISSTVKFTVGEDRRRRRGAACAGGGDAAAASLSRVSKYTVGE
mmetsp:Transcript_5031/g.12553  ORF Transcript_5031/g.12553 Transcript_5031/m.12553 type:complete len:208 (-) Transcript_5031:1512-2135(-)